MRLIWRALPDVTVWFHQPFGLVDLREGADARLVRHYARASGLPARRITGVFTGTATSWQHGALPETTAFVVELPPGPVSAAAASRHVGAVRAVAARAACVNLLLCR